MKRYMYSMSKSKSDLGDYFESATRPIIEHLIKLYLYPDNASVNHWRREVAKFLNSSDTLKGSHKLPSAKFIVDNTFKVHQHFIPGYMKQILYLYRRHTADIDALNHIDAITQQICKYFEWIANKLSHEAQIPFPEIYEYLETHGF